ncbi:MAG: hypothetical protein NUW37_00630 [Planctomycetes bacterium]|nr:hypothetical protein [Planctomycetota bacterium]
MGVALQVQRPEVFIILQPTENESNAYAFSVGDFIPGAPIVRDLGREDWTAGYIASGATLMNFSDYCPSLSMNDVPEYKSQEEMKRTLAEIEGLEDGWDGYGGRGTNPVSIGPAKAFTVKLLEANVPLPKPVPTGSGTIGFCWSLYGVELEVEVVGDDAFDVYFHDEETGHSESEDVSSFEELNKRYLSKFRERRRSQKWLNHRRKK